MTGSQTSGATAFLALNPVQGQPFLFNMFYATHLNALPAIGNNYPDKRQGGFDCQ